ncbi:Ni/Fe hydrogenase subunit alpha [Candidatus Woesebacteria bacterium]|nr:Ni/Fe hydrogenase subunit alpha [Candidatus Woesebacteria bacterium]
MHSGEITIESISKIEGTAGLKVTVEDNVVKDLKFIIKDYRRFYTQAVKGKPIISVPSFLSRICGTCSVAHLFAAIEAIEKSQGIAPSKQTMTLRRLTYDALMIRDHALHLYFFVLPDLLGIDSILDIPDDHDDWGHQLLHDSFDIKQLGTDISNLIAGAAIHAPMPTIGGFLKMPDVSKFPELIKRLEEIRPAVLRGIDAFFKMPDVLDRNSDYLALRSEDRYEYLEGDVLNTDGKRVPESEFRSFLKSVVIPYSQAEGYTFSDTHEDYLVGSLARINLNKDKLRAETKEQVSQYLEVFPSNNVYHNNLAQAIEILEAVNDAIYLMNSVNVTDEKPVKKPYQAGVGVGVVEAPRGILYHMAEVDESGKITDYDVIVPTAQNQINIENDLKKYFNENLDKGEEELRLDAEKIIRAYDPCMSCATNFLKIDWIRK